jgi:Pyridine nucleotide-disulphide oxidoreductase
MELNVWTSTNIVGQPSFDRKTHVWNVRLSRGDGTQREVHPRHIVLAIGQYTHPYIPPFPGAESFKGDIIHTSKFSGGAKYKGKKTVIIGCCNSAHDIAMDLHDHQAESITMVQRSSTYVVRQQSLERHLFTPLYCEGGFPTEDADLFFCSMPVPVLKLVQQEVTRKMADDDLELLTQLGKQGFKVDYGYEGSGIFIKFLTRGGARRHVAKYVLSSVCL